MSVDHSTMPDRRYFVETAARAIAMLRAVEEMRGAPASLADLVAKLGWSKPTTYRFVRTLDAIGALRQVDGKGYVLGPALITLGLAALRGTRVPDIAHPYIVRLSETTGETVFLSILDDTEVVYLDRIDSAEILLRARLEVGSRLPAFVTSSGKVLLAALTEQEVRNRHVDCRFGKFGPKAVRSVEELLASLTVVRKLGYAVTQDELTLGHASVAVPIRDHTGATSAAIGISGSLARLSDARVVELATNHLIPVAGAVSAALGRGIEQQPSAEGCLG